MMVRSASTYSMCITCIQCLWRPEDGVRSLGTGVTVPNRYLGAGNPTWVPCKSDECSRLLSHLSGPATTRSLECLLHVRDLRQIMLLPSVIMLGLQMKGLERERVSSLSCILQLLRNGDEIPVQWDPAPSTHASIFDPIQPKALWDRLYIKAGKAEVHLTHGFWNSISCSTLCLSAIY